MKDNKLTEIAVAWKNTSKAGKPYYSGYFGSARLLIFPNEHKTEEKHPDIRLYVAPKEERDTKSSARNDADDAPDDFDLPF